MESWDLLLTIAIVGVAVRYLYHRFTASRGCTCCSSGCSAKDCHLPPAAEHQGERGNK